MKATDNPSHRVFEWLKANLGNKCLAPLTGTDTRALQAAVMIVQLWQQCDTHYEGDCYEAYRQVVQQMQVHTRELAYHAVAMVADWHVRDIFWDRSQLPPLVGVRICAGEPGGRDFVHRRQRR